MTMRTISSVLLILATALSSASAQVASTSSTPPTSKKDSLSSKVTTTGLVTVTVELNGLQPNEAVKLLREYVQDPRGSVSMAGGKLVLRDVSSGITLMKQVLADANHPVPAVTLTFELIQARDGAPTPNSAPASIDSVLRSVLRYNSYQVLGRATGSAGVDATFSQTVAIDSGNTAYSIMASIGSIRQSGGAGSVHLTVSLRRTPGDHSTPSETVISTGLDVPLGQSIVLGTTAVRGMVGALVLVVKPELLVAKKE